MPGSGGDRTLHIAWWSVKALIGGNVKCSKGKWWSSTLNPLLRPLNLPM